MHTRPRQIAHRWLALVALCPLLLNIACSKKGSPTLAELERVEAGRAEKKRGEGAWENSSAGDKFKKGDALRTSDDGKAVLLYGGKSLWMGPSTVVYFGKKSFDFQGEIEIGEAVFDMDLDFGLVEMSSDGRLRLRKSKDKLDFELLFGQATVSTGGERTELAVGEELVFDLGEGSIERMEPPAPDAAPAPEVDAGLPDAAPELADNELPTTLVVRKKVVQLKESNSGAWSSKRSGEHELIAGTELKLPRKAEAVVVRGDQRIQLTGPALARVGGEGDALLRIESGRARARVSEGSTEVSVPGGSVLVESSAGPGDTQVNVEKKSSVATVRDGVAELRNQDGQSERLRLGESAELRDNGQIKIISQGPRSAHMSVPAAKRLNIHTVTRNLNLRLSFGEHCSDGVVEVAKGSSFKRSTQMRQGKGSAILTLGQGQHRYRLRCYQGGKLADKAATSGVIKIDRQSGSRPLPKGAPANTVDTDGRKYTVLYQNRLPAMTFRWPGAPSQGPFELHLRRNGGKTELFKSPTPSKSLKSGTVKEGDYEYWFESKGGTSKHTRLRVAFDNAASSGYLIAPKTKAKLSGSAVRVAGAALSGWTVSVDGEKLELDGQHRFDTEVPVSKDGSVAIRFFHPKHGAHYYLRGGGK